MEVLCLFCACLTMFAYNHEAMSFVDLRVQCAPLHIMCWVGKASSLGYHVAECGRREIYQ